MYVLQLMFKRPQYVWKQIFEGSILEFYQKICELEIWWSTKMLLLKFDCKWMTFWDVNLKRHLRKEFRWHRLTIIWVQSYLDLIEISKMEKIITTKFHIRTIFTKLRLKLFLFQTFMTQWLVHFASQQMKSFSKIQM